MAVLGGGVQFLMSEVTLYTLQGYLADYLEKTPGRAGGVWTSALRMEISSDCCRASSSTSHRQITCVRAPFLSYRHFLSGQTQTLALHGA
jgi:hypothetical protein